ncbi:MAG: CpXC domain-containing protein, partial [Anaerolineae bacterium]
MYTQITCPNCKTPFTAEVHQVIDAEQNPELKQKLLSGQLNLAICPSCGAGGQMGTGLLFHDPAHELFMVYVPQELQINQMEREKLVGQLVQQAMNNIPQEKRRAYMLQPQTVLSMQTFMEKVLETEGITKEMIERQKKQAELLNSLATADNDVVEYLLKERANEIDETFFAMLQSYVDTAAQLNDNSQLIKLTNLRAKLMTETAVGRELEKRQIALHKFNQDAKKQGGLSTKLLLKHILANQEDDKVVDALVMAGQQAVRYELFAQMTHEIEKLEKKKKLAEAQQLISIRERVLKLYEKMQAESRKILGKAEELLNLLKDAPDKETAVRANMQRFDDAFMYLL